MKHFTCTVCLIFLLLWLIVAVPVSAVSPAISDISPSTGYNDGKIRTYTITGTNFTETEGDVWLEKSGKSDIESYSSITNWSSNEIVCRFKIPLGTTTGSWTLVVKGSDNIEIKKTYAFTITEAMSLTSISPLSGRLDDDEVDFTIIGTGLLDVEDVFLYNNDYDNITAVDVVGISATKVEGTFDLTGTDEDTYDVCVVDDSGTEECDLSFEITTDEVGSIEISSSPSGASIFVDGSSMGTTPDTVDDLVEGSYKIVLKKSGYNDWGKIVKVTAGDTSIVDADLEVMTTTSTTVRTTAPTTVKTIVKSTLKVPTSWPSDTPTTAASPVDPAAVIGAAGVGIGLAAIRRR
jgi:hypothetical protein